MRDLAESDEVSAKNLIACPRCDALHVEAPLPAGASARCRRCGTVLMTSRDGAMTRIVMLAATALVLMIAAVFFPFLELNANGIRQRSSVFDAIMAFSDGLMLPLSFAVAVLIVILPLLRFIALLYVLGPMALGWKPAQYAAKVFRFSEAAKPWAMAEIFIVGVSVALVKVAGLAKVSLGPAFWALVALVIVTVLKDTYLSQMMVWKTLEERSKS